VGANNTQGGKRLRQLRLRLGLTLREVERLTRELARSQRNPSLVITISRLADLEVRGTIPNINRLYALSQIYDCEVRDLLACYGLR